MVDTHTHTHTHTQRERETKTEKIIIIRNERVCARGEGGGEREEVGGVSSSQPYGHKCYCVHAM